MTADPCKGVVYRCVGDDLYHVKGIDGKCVPTTIYKHAHEICEYAIPGDEPNDNIHDNTTDEPIDQPDNGETTRNDVTDSPDSKSILDQISEMLKIKPIYIIIGILIILAIYLSGER